MHVCIEVVAIDEFLNSLNCDPAWENSAYVHTKFDHVFRLWILISFCLNNETFTNSTANNWKFNTICDRICEKESYTCIWFCDFEEA